MKDFLDFIRGITRPVVTLMLVGTLCGIVVHLLWDARIRQVPELSAEVWAGLITAFTTAVAVAVGFWFASRNNRPPGT